MKRDVAVILAAVAAVTLVSLVPPASALPAAVMLGIRAVAAVALSVIVVVFYDLARRAATRSK